MWRTMVGPRTLAIRHLTTQDLREASYPKKGDEPVLVIFLLL